MAANTGYLPPTDALGHHPHLANNHFVAVDYAVHPKVQSIIFLLKYKIIANGSFSLVLKQKFMFKTSKEFVICHYNDVMLLVQKV